MIFNAAPVPRFYAWAFITLGIAGMALQRTLVAGIYPVQSIELRKPCAFADADAVVEVLLRQLEDHPSARLIAVFDHLEHAWEFGSDIPSDVRAVRNVVFCVDNQLPIPDCVPLRPRAIGVTELTDRFVVNSMELPDPEFNATVAAWLNALTLEGA
jgi:hypothetical protein